MKNEMEIKTEAICQRRRRVRNKLLNTLRAKNISRAAKIRAYETLIRSVGLYASETWLMTKKAGQKLKIWGRNCFRNIFGGEWRRRTVR